MTTYVLGAGASLHAGYPLAGQLGNELYDWIPIDKPQYDVYRMRIDIVREQYGNLADLERILTELEECPVGSPMSKLSVLERKYAEQALLILIPEFFYDLRQRQSPLYEQLAHERIKEGDVIITFNYDLACERALKNAGLWEISDGYGFQLGTDAIPPSKVKVLKLHGSTNWWGPIFGGMRGFCQVGPNSLPFRPVILFKRDFEFFSYSQEISDPLCAGITMPAAIPALITLTRHKRFYVPTSSGGHEWAEFWTDIWAQADLALRSAEKIIVIGYSLPIADREARELLFQKSNKQAKIALYCGHRSQFIRDEFRSYGFTGVETSGKGLFEEFLGGRPAFVPLTRVQASHG